MYPLFESIRVEGGQLHLLHYHQDRMARAYNQLYKKKCPWKLEAMLLNLPRTGLHKLRFLYNDQNFSYEIASYQTRTITSLKLFEIGDYRYDLKFTNRSFLNEAFSLRGSCDDVLMTRKGYITDTSYCNIILFDGVQWVTPAQPLFEGVQRQFLLDQKTIVSQQIHTSELNNFQSFMLVNVMRIFDKRFLLSTERIQKTTSKTS